MTARAFRHQDETTNARKINCGRDYGEGSRRCWTWSSFRVWK